MQIIIRVKFVKIPDIFLNVIQKAVPAHILANISEYAGNKIMSKNTGYSPTIGCLARAGRIDIDYAITIKEQGSKKRRNAYVAFFLIITNSRRESWGGYRLFIKNMACIRYQNCQRSAFFLQSVQNLCEA